MSNYKLLSVGNNAKTVKGDGSEYLTAILYLAPSTNSGINVCPMAKIASCDKACLYSAGRGRFSSVQAGRMRKTVLWRDNRDLFLALLRNDLIKFERYCVKRGIQPVVRLNGTSDIMWENHIDFAGEFPAIQFYDYTKIVKRVYKKLPSNYHLTLSYSEANPEYAASVMQAHKDTGANVAVVFRSKDAIPSQFMQSMVLDGDKDDLRFLDMPRHVVALYAKGQATKDTTGFVIG
jgi:hypothetical protein